MGLLSNIGKVIFGDPTEGIEKGADQQYALQERGLDLTEKAVLPRLEREQEASDLLMGFLTDPEKMKQFYTDAEQSPTFDYQRDMGEESLLRTSAATGYGGGLRGGGTKLDIASLSPNILNNLVNQRLTGLQSFAMPTNISPVTNTLDVMGQNRLGRATGVAQAEQDLAGQTANLALKAFGAF